MEHRDKPALREMLAAEYALGTLRGGARRRFEAWMRDDRALASLAAAWSQRLVPFVDAIGPVVPPKRVWDAIEARLPGFAARNGFAAPVSWWDRLGLWRGLTAAFATLAVVAFAMALQPAPTPQTRFVTVEAMPRDVATIVDPKSGAPVAVVVGMPGDALLVEVMPDVVVGSGQGLQLWMASADGPRMVSLGMLPPAAKGRPMRIPVPRGVSLVRAKALGLSREPAGGSPQPTDVLGLGPLMRLTT